MQQIFANPSLLIIFVLAVISLMISGYTLFAALRLNRLKAIFFRGSAAADLETVIHTLTQGQQTLSQEHVIAADHINKLYEQLAGAVQKVGVVRFNPFSDGGGNFSFSVALLDGRDNGVVITSMYGRQQNRIYTKKISQGISETELTQEEQQAITKANS